MGNVRRNQLPKFVSGNCIACDKFAPTAQTILDFAEATIITFYLPSNETKLPVSEFLLVYFFPLEAFLIK